MSAKPFGQIAYTRPYINYWSLRAATLKAVSDHDLRSGNHLTLIMWLSGDEVLLDLVLAGDESCWVVKDFGVPIKVGLLSGYTLLAHYAKRCAMYNEDVTHPGDMVWKIKCARDLQSLLEEYDKLAKELGFQVLFGH